MYSNIPIKHKSISHSNVKQTVMPKYLLEKTKYN